MKREDLSGLKIYDNNRDTVFTIHFIEGLDTQTYNDVTIGDVTIGWEGCETTVDYSSDVVIDQLDTGVWITFNSVREKKLERIIGNV